MTKCPSTANPVSGSALHQIEELLRQRLCRLHLPPGHMKLRQSPECPRELRRLPHLLAQGMARV